MQTAEEQERIQAEVAALNRFSIRIFCYSGGSRKRAGSNAWSIQMLRQVAQ